jgi:hypothetical protein
VRLSHFYKEPFYYVGLILVFRKLFQVTDKYIFATILTLKITSK